MEKKIWIDMPLRTKEWGPMCDVRGVEADTLKYQRIRLTVDDNLVISSGRETLEAAFVAAVNTRLVARAAHFRNHFLSSP